MDPGFQVRGGAFKIIEPGEARSEHFWGISCEKSRFYEKKIIFFPILGGRAPLPPGSAPGLSSKILKSEKEGVIYSTRTIGSVVTTVRCQSQNIVSLQ